MTLYNLLTGQIRDLTGVNVYPVDYKGSLPEPPYLLVEFLTPKVNSLYQEEVVVGQIIFQGYFDSGFGQSEPFDMLSTLSKALGRLSVSNLIITSYGMVPVSRNEDSDTKSLSRYDYTFNFHFYGET